MNVIVIGGGWAGLAAAVELVRHGAKVTVLEATRQLGGRARGVRFGPNHVDNGQHLLLGAYHSVLAVLRAMGVRETDVFRRLPLSLVLRNPGGEHVGVNALPLPAPLHLLAGLLTARGLEWGARVAALRFLRRARADKFEVAPDVPLADYLERCGQHGAETRALWQPLCLAALNTPIARASTRLFLRVLRDAFFGARHDSDLLLPVKDLGECLPRPALDFIESRGGSVRLAARAHAVGIEHGAVTGVMVRDEPLAAEHVIVATPPEACLNLLREHAPLAETVERLGALSAEPICTAYLQYPESVTLGRDFLGVLDSTVQWLFDHGRLTGRGGLIAAVISGPGPHIVMNNEALSGHIQREIARIFPGWPQPLAVKVIRERRATISAVPGVDRYRPGHATNIKGLWLAGDYTATGYPSTLEGAVRSGLICARRILKQERRAP